ncbi:hypothetical protein NP493_1236g00014 [Ridgeia piscesae]|uniref:Uncharacterized protein n=1 Tax=Ridgeia piscesae TaxID=27915 RepID=A0AAD9KBH9_RIDPI|nr:hypothetical protein NP493_1236g00014 [Ridgeia piscesae]
MVFVGAGCLKHGTLVVVQKKVIHVMEKTPSGKYEITRQLITGGAITVDEVHGFVYWSNTKKVRRATLDSSNQMDIYVSDEYVYGLAVNPEEDKLYISDFRGKKIVVTSLDGNGGRTLITCTGNPTGLVLDLCKR